jgi:hypothetical protein
MFEHPAFFVEIEMEEDSTSALSLSLSLFPGYPNLGIQAYSYPARSLDAIQAHPY